jgi:transposase
VGGLSRGASFAHRAGYERAHCLGHRYITLVCALQPATVEYIGEERREASLVAHFEAFPETSRQQIEAISLDMWPATFPP